MYEAEIIEAEMHSMTALPLQVDTDSNSASTDSIPTSAENVNTKYSARDTELKKQYEKVNRQLERENAQLREDVKNLRELNRLQGQVTGGKVFKNPSIQSVGKRIMKQYNAVGNTVRKTMRLCTQSVGFLQQIQTKKKLFPISIMVLKILNHQLKIKYPILTVRQARCLAVFCQNKQFLCVIFDIEIMMIILITKQKNVIII